MEELGALLQQRRQERGLSLADVEAALKIRRAYLEALESGRKSALPAEVYTRGFIRLYAEYLGLDAAEAIRLYESGLPSRSPDAMRQDAAAWSETETARARPARRTARRPRRRRDSEGQPARTGRGGARLHVPPGPMQRRARERWSGLITLLLLGALVAAVLVYWPEGDGEPGQIAGGEPPSVEEPDSGGPDAPGEAGNEPPEEAPPSVEGPEDLAQPQLEYRILGADRVHVQLAADAPCWLEARADGALLEQRTLQPGESIEYEAEEALSLIVGYPAGIALTVNGEELGKLTSPNPQDLSFLREDPGGDL